MDAVNAAVGKAFDWLGLCFSFIVDKPLLLALCVVPLGLGILAGMLSIFRR